MADSIQFRRGLRSTVKPLPVGMPGFIEDEERLVIGKGDGTNTELPNKADMDNIDSQMADIAINIKTFGAKCNANYFNSNTQKWYEDSTFTIEAHDDTQAIQNAIDFACSNAPIRVRAVKGYGRCLITSTINATNSRQTGTVLRDGLAIIGETYYHGLTLVGETGKDHAILETTGSQWLKVENLKLEQGQTANASTIGLYQGLSAILPQTQNQNYKNLTISMDDDITANNGAGTIGIWNFGAEENTYDTIYISANRSLVLTGHNDSSSSISGYQYSYQTLSTSHSLGVTTFIGECFLVSIGKNVPPILTEDVNSLHMQNVYISNIGGTTGANVCAIEVRGSLKGFIYGGTIEQLATFWKVYGKIESARVNAVFGSVIDTASEIISLQRGGQGILANSELNFTLLEDTSRNLISATPVGTNEQISCAIENTRIKTNLNMQYCKIPENLLWNALTDNVEIYSDNPSNKLLYSIKNRKHIIKILPTLLWNGTITNANVLNIITPSVIASTSGGAISLRIKGIIKCQGYSTNAMSTKFFEAIVSVVSNNNGEITTIVDIPIKGATLNVNAEGNDITDVAVSTSTNGNITQIIVTPSRSGVNNDPLVFVGEAEMLWHGWSSVAPRIELP